MVSSLVPQCSVCIIRSAGTCNVHLPRLKWRAGLSRTDHYAVRLLLLCSGGGIRFEDRSIKGWLIKVCAAAVSIAINPQLEGAGLYALSV